jgi:hypothetical protein
MVMSTLPVLCCVSCWNGIVSPGNGQSVGCKQETGIEFSMGARLGNKRTNRKWKGQVTLVLRIALRKWVIS